MWREAHAHASAGRTLSFGSVRRTTRLVLVRVLDGAREVDGFQASNIEALRSALRPIYRHLPPRRGKVEMTGVEESWLPLGLGRTRREVQLPTLEAAMAFVGGSS